jgi:hypothetical protein
MPPPKRTKKPPPRRRKASKQPEPAVEPTPVPPVDHEVPDEPGEYGRVEVRLRVLELLQAGYSSELIVEQLMEQPKPPLPEASVALLGGFGVSRATGWRYVKHVRAKLAELETGERPQIRAELAHMQRFGIREAARDREWTAFNGGIRNLADLYGLRVQKVEMQGGGIDALVEALTKTPVQRDADLEELERLARGGAGPEVPDGADPG